MVKIRNKLEKASQCLEYFTLQQWRFIDDNVKHLNSLLSAEDRREFHFDVRDIDWSAYLEQYILGIRSFIFKEHPSSLPTARKKVQRSALPSLCHKLCAVYVVDSDADQMSQIIWLCDYFHFPFQ